MLLLVLLIHGLSLHSSFSAPPPAVYLQSSLFSFRFALALAFIHLLRALLSLISEGYAEGRWDR
jgi:hypothetical protein